MMVVVSPGAEPTGGYSVEITGLMVQDDLLQHPLAPECTNPEISCRNQSRIPFKRR